MGTGGPFPAGKARPGRDADHSPPSSAEVKYEQLYLLYPLVPPRRVAGQLYFTIITKDPQTVTTLFPTRRRTNSQTLKRYIHIVNCQRNYFHGDVEGIRRLS
jgi:hypothetical protein